MPAPAGMKEPTLIAGMSGKFSFSFKLVFSSETSINVSLEISFTRFSILGETLLAESGNGTVF